jgi:hypothetical protein
MSVSEASACAIAVVTLYGDIIRESENLQDPLPLNDDLANVPPFLVKSVS